MKMYQRLASVIDAYHRSVKSSNEEWENKHKQTIYNLLSNLPSGSGWDEGTKLDLDRSSEERLVLYGGYHHMNEIGMYDGWTFHKIVVTPSLHYEFRLRISGQNRNDIKDYLHELFDNALRLEV